MITGLWQKCPKPQPQPRLGLPFYIKVCYVRITFVLGLRGKSLYSQSFLPVIMRTVLQTTFKCWRWAFLLATRQQPSRNEELIRWSLLVRSSIVPFWGQGAILAFSYHLTLNLISKVYTSSTREKLPVKNKDERSVATMLNKEVKLATKLFPIRRFYSININIHPT